MAFLVIYFLITFRKNLFIFAHLCGIFFFSFNWRIIALQYSFGFCHTSLWISHKYPYVPFLLNPFPPPPHPTPLGYQRAPGTHTAAIYFTQGSVYIYRRRQWYPTPVLLPGNSDGWRGLVGCSPWGPEELDMTERLHFHFSLSCIGEGNGNPLQSSPLENPKDGGAWWAAVYGAAQSRTRLKRLSSSSSSSSVYISMLRSQFVALSPSPAVSKVCSLCLHLYSCPANRFISIIFLNSIYICVNT